jgi:hypothetical protein
MGLVTRSSMDRSNSNLAARSVILLRIFCTIQICFIDRIDVVVLLRKARDFEVKFGQVRNFLVDAGSLARHGMDFLHLPIDSHRFHQ